mmetsp:Transcript_9342/g.15640  ORF Transcript_9342/g.15640 Transcript_9342/m.15640 type:complete len:119 (+) Transcript_9342:178-534(+)
MLTQRPSQVSKTSSVCQVFRTYLDGTAQLFELICCIPLTAVPTATLVTTGESVLARLKQEGALGETSDFGAFHRYPVRNDPSLCFVYFVYVRCCQYDDGSWFIKSVQGQILLLKASFS